VHRSAGVTVIAILQFLGSLLTLGMAGLMVLALVMVSKQQVPSAATGSPIPMPALMAICVAMYLFPAVWGLITGVGLWRLRNWARISTIVFAVILCFFGAFGCLTALAMPIFLSSMPTQVPNPQQFKVIMVTFMLLVGLGELGIGLWWAIYFTRRSVIAQFAQTLAETPAGLSAAPLQPAAITSSRRPISISIIAWFLLVSAFLFLPFALLVRSPQLLFGQLLTGVGAFALSTIYLLVIAYVGIGLLKLWPSARLVGIGYFAFGILNMAITWLRPGASELFQRMMAAQPRIFAAPPSMNFPEAFFKAIMIGTALTMAVPIYFLATRKSAFDHGERSI
jgi:uncharacterized membrane protein (DUF2068 family)